MDVSQPQVRDEPIIARIWEDYVNKAAAASATEQAEESVEVAAVPEEKGTVRVCLYLLFYISV